MTVHDSITVIVPEMTKVWFSQGKNSVKSPKMRKDFNIQASTIHMCNNFW